MMPDLGIFGSAIEEKPSLDAWLFRWGIGIDESRARLAKESTTFHGSPQLPMAQQCACSTFERSERAMGWRIL